VLTALDADDADLQLGPGGARGLDVAGYESDGGEEVEVPKADLGKTKAWFWRFNKSPLGEWVLELWSKRLDRHGRLADWTDLNG